VARLLVTGASGLLGANLVLTAAGTHEVVAVCHRHPIRLDGVRTICADLSQPGVAGRLFQEELPEWVVHCAAATDVDACEEDPEWADRLNRSMAGEVAVATRGVGARLTHISTDAVFDGEKGNYTEDDVPTPINTYGRTKLAGERAVLEAYPEAMVVRTNIFGWNVQQKQSLAEWFLANLEAGQECNGYEDVWITPILANDLAEILVRMLATGMRGLYHVAGADCVSKYEFGLKLAEVFGLDGSLIRPISVDEAGLKARRPKRLCLRTNKMNMHGREIGGIAIRHGIIRLRDLKTKGESARVRMVAQTGPAQSPPSGSLRD